MDDLPTWTPVAVRERDGRAELLVQWADGHVEWREARVTVARTITDADGQVTVSGEVASTDNRTLNLTPCA